LLVFLPERARSGLGVGEAADRHDATPQRAPRRMLRRGAVRMRRCEAADRARLGEADREGLAAHRGGVGDAGGEGGVRVQAAEAEGLGHGEAAEGDEEDEEGKAEPKGAADDCRVAAVHWPRDDVRHARLPRLLREEQDGGDLDKVGVDAQDERDGYLDVRSPIRTSLCGHSSPLACLVLRASPSRPLAPRPYRRPTGACGRPACARTDT